MLGIHIAGASAPGQYAESWVDLLFVKGFDAGQPIVYVSTDAGQPLTAVLERSTYVPALDKAAYNGGDDFLGSARERLFGFINGQTGAHNDQAQGFVHLIKDGHAAEDASAGNTALINALRHGGDLLNVFGDFPTLRDPRHAQAYSPLWDAQLGLWTQKAIDHGLDQRQIDEVQVFNLAASRPDLLTGVDPATGKPAPYGSVGVDINCAVIGFTANPPTANLAAPLPTRSFRPVRADGWGGAGHPTAPPTSNPITSRKEFAMSKLLYVISSPRGSQSDSSQLAERFLEAYRAHRPGLEVDRLDLWHDQLPVYGGAGVDAKMTLIAGGRLEGDQRQAWQEVRQVFERFDAADEYLFAVPMWNAGVPWVLKHLIDTISQPGMMFGFDPTDGYTGLLQGKRAVVAYTSAVYAPGVPASFGADFHATFFNDWLRFVGIEEISEIRLQATALSTDQEAQRSRAFGQATELGLRLALTQSRAA